MHRRTAVSGNKEGASMPRVHPALRAVLMVRELISSARFRGDADREPEIYDVRPSRLRPA
jgi:hypothetical protein